MRLLNGLRNKPYCNTIHFFGTAVIFFMLGLKYWFFLLLLVLYLIYLYKKLRLLIPTLVVLGLFMVSLSLHQLPKLKPKENYTCRITEIEDTGYTGWIGLCKVKIMDKNHNFVPGDIISCKLKLLTPSSKSYEADLDYAEYLRTKGIRYYARAEDASLIRSGFSIAGIKYSALRFYQNHLSKESYAYVSALVFAENNLGEDLQDSYSILGISHILAISGLHIMLLYRGIRLLLLKLFHCYKETPSLLILTAYTLIIGCPAPCVRALLCLVLGCLNQRGTVQYTRLDILSLGFLAALIFNPYQIYGVSFKLSYLVSFILIFMPELCPSKSKLKTMYISFYFIFFMTFPIVLNLTNYLSLSALFLSPLLSMAVSFILLPITYILTVFPFLDSFLQYGYRFMNEYLLGLSRNALGLNMISMTLWMMLVYYLLFGAVLIAVASQRHRIRSWLIFLLYMVILLSVKYISPIHRVTFVDVGQGDCALIELGNQRGNMVIDAYHCIDYLKSTGISKIDYLVLTHSDNDHIADARKIMEYFQVSHILYSGYDDGFSGYDGIKITYNTSFTLGDIEIHILAPIQEYSLTNSNSVVLRFEIEDCSFLFCGDMTLEEEEDLIELYGRNLKSDVLKVGHHGSATSSGNEFIRLVQPVYSIISVGADNSYNLPDKSVIDRLQTCSTVFQTKDCGNITFNFLKNKKWITTYR